MKLLDGLRQWMKGKMRRDEGMALAAEAQGSDWGNLAYDAIEQIAKRQPTVHVDDVLESFSEKPRHPNAWGAVWMRAIRAGIIERSESYRSTKDPTKHAHVYPVYTSLVWGDR